MLTIAEVEAASGANGLRVASLFAGIGGSSLGYRLAGFEVVYACEWDAAAAATYALNGTVQPDTRDVREVTAADVGDVDVLDGSPPCQDFCHLGKRNADGERAMLYYEFVRLVGEVRPPAFVAENVEGFVTGAMRSRHFLPILRDLRGLGYRVEARTLDASWLGAPQARRRVILIGLRHGDPAQAFPRRRERQTAIRDALPHIARIVRPAGRVEWFSEDGGFAYRQTPVLARRFKWCEEDTRPASGPAPTITRCGMGEWGSESVVFETCDGERRPPTIGELKTLCGFPRDFEFAEGAEPWHQLGNAVLPPMSRAWADCLGRALRAPGRRVAGRYAAKLL